MVLGTEVRDLNIELSDDQEVRKVREMKKYSALTPPR
jgi:hypothetical protein